MLRAGQVLSRAFEVVAVIARAFPVCKRDAFIALDGLVDKMPDIKLKGPASEVRRLYF